MDQETLRDLKHRQRIGFIILFLLLMGACFAYMAYDTDQTIQGMEKEGEKATSK